MGKLSDTRCPVLTCRRVFSSAYNLGKHVKVIHLCVKDFECPSCGRLFGYKHTLRNHVALHDRLTAEIKANVKAGLQALTGLLALRKDLVA